MAQQQQQQQQQQQPGRWWQQDDIYGVTPQHTGRSHASRSMHSREDQVVGEKRPPLPPRRSTSSFQQPWQQDDIYGVTPQHTGGTLLSQHTQPSPARTRDGGPEPRERAPPVPAKIPLAPERGPPPRPEKEPPPLPKKEPPPLPEKRPPLPPRRSTSSTSSFHHQQEQHHHHHHRQSWNVPDRAPPPPPLPPQTSATDQRSKEHVVAYMIPLPQPLGPHGLPLAIPQRYMLYLPPAPDLLKPDAATTSSADGGTGAKERKRDKAHRRWQEEVRKAKTYNGAVVTMRGLYSASVRGAVYVLAKLQRSELTFLSRLPRRTLRELELMHPGGNGSGGGAEADEERFAEVRAEFERNRRVARRDFWIAAALLPFATAVDLVIPVFGGLSEVDMVWMVVTGRAWMAARGVAKRLVLAPGAAAARALSDGRGSSSSSSAGSRSGHERGGGGARPYECAGALGGHDDDDDDDDSSDDDSDEDSDDDHRQPRVGNFTEHLDDEEHLLVGDDEKKQGDVDNNNRGYEHKHKQKKDKEQPVEMSFRPSTSMTMLTHYVQAACHARNARLFPDVGAPGAEAEVLRSIGWAPVEGRVRHDAADNHYDDVAWQVRKTCEDLRGAVAKAAKTWDKQCRRFAAADPERAMGVATGARAQGRKELLDE